MKLLLAFLLLADVYAQGDVMFSEAEKEALQQALEHAPKAGVVQSTNMIRLDGIVYQGENNWRVWINGVPYAPDSDVPWGKITSVEPDCVVIERGEKSISLVVGQSYGVG